jgi:hypothetical protein
LVNSDVQMRPVPSSIIQVCMRGGAAGVHSSGDGRK